MSNLPAPVQTDTTTSKYPAAILQQLAQQANPNPLVRLFTSSKALVVILVTVACFAALFAGKVAWPDISEFLKWVLGPWLLAQGVEDAAKYYGASKPVDPGVASATSNVLVTPPNTPSQGTPPTS